MPDRFSVPARKPFCCPPPVICGASGASSLTTSAPAPWGLPQLDLDDEYLTYAAQPDGMREFKYQRKDKRGHGTIAPDRMITFADILHGTNRGRTSREQITYSEGGNLQGNQFWAVAGAVYEAAKAKGVGREIPTEWFLQDIRD